MPNPSQKEWPKNPMQLAPDSMPIISTKKSNKISFVVRPKGFGTPNRSIQNSNALEI